MATNSGKKDWPLSFREHENDDPETLNSRLIQHVELFRGREPWPDDITLLTCKLF
jgi:serine phosphatase RsbU (regulator of sigma subunit)